MEARQGSRGRAGRAGRGRGIVKQLGPYVFASKAAAKRELRAILDSSRIGEPIVDETVRELVKAIALVSQHAESIGAGWNEDRILTVRPDSYNKWNHFQFRMKDGSDFLLGASSAIDHPARAPTWTHGTHRLFPAEFQSQIQAFVLTRRGAALPQEVLEKIAATVAASASADE